MELNSIVEEMKNDTLRDLNAKIRIVRNIIEHFENLLTTNTARQNDEMKKIKSLPIEKLVQTLCQVESYSIYQATKLAGDRKLPLNSWLNILSSKNTKPSDNRGKAIQLREPFIEAYLVQRAIPLEDHFTQYIRIKTNLRAIPIISGYLTNYFTFCPLPKTRKGIIIEKSERLNERILYLKKIMQYRGEGRKIIYLDERITFSRNIWNDNYEFHNACTHCIMLLNEEGNMVDFNLVFRYSHDGASKFILNFVENNLGHLPPNCVVVLCDKGYHQQNFKPLPTKFSSKKEMKAWLDDVEIDYNKDWHRAELYKLIEVHKRDYKVQYYVDDYFKFHGHDVVRRPAHCQFFSHFNDFWSEVHNFAHQKHPKLQLSFVIRESIKEAGEIFTPDIWKEKERTMINEEHRILIEDLQVEEIIDRLRTMAKYGDADETNLDTIDLDHPFLEGEYNYSKQVASCLDETERCLIRPN